MEIWSNRDNNDNNTAEKVWEPLLYVKIWSTENE